MSQEILVELVGDEADAEAIDKMTVLLADEINHVDEVESVEALAGEAPGGTKAVEFAAIGALVVAAAPTVEAVGRIARVVREWFSRRPDSAPTTTLKMTVGDKSIEFSATAEQHEQAFAEFLAAVRQG